MCLGPGPEGGAARPSPATQNQVCRWGLPLGSAVAPAPAVTARHLPRSSPPLGSVKHQLCISTGGCASLRPGGGSLGPASPAGLAFSRHQPGLKGVVVTGVTAGRWHIHMSGQQRILKVIQTQQPHLTGGETEAREGGGLPKDT